MADLNTRRAARRKRKRNTRKRRANRKLDRLRALRARLLRATTGRGRGVERDQPHPIGRPR